MINFAVGLEVAEKPLMETENEVEQGNLVNILDTEWLFLLSLFRCQQGRGDGGGIPRDGSHGGSRRGRGHLLLHEGLWEDFLRAETLEKENDWTVWFLKIMKILWYFNA